MALNYQLTNDKDLYLGYRTVEGGADNKVVYNFAWFNSLVFGIQSKF